MPASRDEEVAVAALLVAAVARVSSTRASVARAERRAVPVEREAAPVGELQEAGEGGLLIEALDVGRRGPQAGEHDGEGMGGAGGSGPAQEVDRRSHHLVGVQVAERHLREATARQPAVAPLGAGRVGEHLDVEGGERVGPDVHHLARGGVRPVVEVDRDRRSAVEAQGHPGDPAVDRRGRGEERERARRDGLRRAHDEALAADRIVARRTPSGGRIAVDGMDGTVLREVLVAPPVGGGVRRDATAVHGDRAGVVGGIGEDGEPGVAPVDHERHEPRGLRVPGGEADGAPALRTAPVAVRDHERRAVVERLLELRVSHGSAVPEELGAVDHAGRSAVDEPVAVPGHHHRRASRLRGDDGQRAPHREHGDRERIAAGSDRG